MEADEFEKEQQRKIINSFNEQQIKYYITSKIDLPSKNQLFIAYRRVYRTIVGNINSQNIVESNHSLFDCDEKKVFALKLLKYFKKRQVEHFDREKIVLELLEDDDRIIKYLDIIPVKLYNKKHILIVMHFYPHVDLQFYLWRPSFTFDEKFICLVTFKALEILCFLKNREIVHNDIKFENFIVTSEYPFEMLLTDFESASIIEINGKTDVIGGTSIFKAPEVLRGEEHDYSADIWSLAINVYYHLYFEYPFGIKFEDNNTKFEKLIEEKIEYHELIRKDDDEVSDNAWEVLSKMLQKNPEDRITAENALKMDWFQFIESTEIKTTTSRINLDHLIDYVSDTPSF